MSKVYDSSLSAIIPEKFQSFVEEYYPVYAEFMVQYYKWLEKDGNPLDFIQRFKNNQDFDLADQDFLLEYLNEFAKDLPENKAVNDDAIVLETVREFYLARGSEQSFKWLFTMLFNADVNIIHPRKFMFRTSDADFGGNIFLRTTANEFRFINEYELQGDIQVQVIGRKSNTIAIVDTYKLIRINNKDYLEFELSSYTKDFIVDEKVDVYFNERHIEEYAIGGLIALRLVGANHGNNIDDDVIISTNGNGQDAIVKVKSILKGGYDSYNIINGGQNYFGDIDNVKVKFRNNNGYGFIGVVRQVDDNGTIEKIDIYNKGTLYKNNLPAKIESLTGSGAIIEMEGERVGKVNDVKILNSGYFYSEGDEIIATLNGKVVDCEYKIGCIFTEPKKYLNTKGFTSWDLVLTDSFYYQVFSYLIKSKIPPNKYVKLIRDLMHPAGTELFTEWSWINSGNVDSTLDSQESKLTNDAVLELSTMEGNIPAFMSNEYVVKSLILSNGNTSIFHNLFIIDENKFDEDFTASIELFENYSIDDINNESLTTQYGHDVIISIEQN